MSRPTGLLCLVLVLSTAACNGCDGVPEGAGGTGGTGGAEGMSIFEVWREVRDTLRESPDHLPARAETLVAAGDREAIFEFVRDAIATYPPSTTGFTNATSAQRWGTAATLRGGAGTPREKAELLAELLERAGHEATVMAGTVDLTRVDPRAILWQSRTADFSPPFDASDVERWSAGLGYDTPPGDATVIDPDGVETSALADALASLLPPDAAADAFDFDSLTRLPVVRLDADGVFANPSVPGAPFDDPMTSDAPTSTSGPYPVPTVRVTLEGARADAPFDPFTLIDASWGADEVAGRRVHLGFAPVATTDELLTLTAGDVSLFVPTLTVDAPGLSAEERASLDHTGDAFSLGGDVYTVSDTDEVFVNGESLGAGESDPGAVESVESLGLTVQPGAFTRIRLQVSALDAAGAQVPGLGADVLAAREDGVEVPFTVRQNAAPPPRVLLFVDASTSMPPEYLGANAVNFADQIITALYAAYSAARLKVGTIFIGADYADYAWATTLADAQAQAAWLETASGTSELWQALAQANDERPTVIILVSDAEATDSLTPEFQSAIAGGAPVLTVGVGTPNTDVLEAVAELSGGSSFVASTPDDAIAAALTEIDARAVEDYTLSYRAPREGPATRTVTVEVDGGRVSTSADYDVPVTPAPPPALARLTLTLRVGAREVSRDIAGYSGDFTTGYVEITDSMRADVEATVLGRISIGFEGAAPNLSVWLDDWISEKLALKPAWDALQSGDEDAMRAAVENGFSVTPAELFLMQSRLPQASTEDAAVFETGLRAVTFVQKAQLDRGWLSQVDVFPRSVWKVAADDPHAAYLTALDRSAYLAVTEAALFDESTASLLDGVPLRRVDSGAASTALADLDPAVTQRWSYLEKPFGLDYQLLLPDAGTPYAFWAVHEASGTVIGVLPDGRGGATREELEANLEATQKVLDQVGKVGGLLGANVGVWVELEKTKAALVTKATILLATGQDPGGWDDPFAKLVCGQLRKGLGKLVPGLSNYFDTIGHINDAGFVLGVGSIPATPGCP